MALRTIFQVVLGLSFAVLCACATATNTVTADSQFKEGEKAFASGKFEQAIEHWKKVKESYSSPELSTEAELKIADAYFENKAYIEAAGAYEDFRKMHPAHPKTPYALYRLGMSHYREVTGIDTDQTPVRNARITFENFLRSYPDSQYAPEVREKLEDCRKKQLAYEVYVGNFYLRTEKYPAAIKRLTEALERFPGLKHDETLFNLGRAHVLNGERAKGEEYFDRLAREYPQSPMVSRARQK